MSACDLHVHTKASDGLLTSEEVVASAVGLGLEAIGLTDHDTVGGINSALEAADGLMVQVIPGIEISTDWRDEEVHVLGYFIDHRLSWLLELLLERQEERVKRAREMVRRLAVLGMEVSWDRVAALAQSGSVGRPQIAAAMLEKGYVQNMREAFNDHLKRGCPAYVPHTPLSPKEAVRIIRNAGGAPVLAHPGMIKQREKVAELLEEGIVGIEVFSPKHDASTVEWLGRIARERSLIATAGSDFHGFYSYGYTSLGSCQAPWETVEALRREAARIRESRGMPGIAD